MRDRLRIQSKAIVRQPTSRVPFGSSPTLSRERPGWSLEALAKELMTKRCRSLRGNAEVLEKGEHVLPNNLMVGVNRAPVLRFPAHFGLGDSGENRADHLFAKQHECGDGPKSLWQYVYRRDLPMRVIRPLPRSFFKS
jgi:hypothetical protein